MVPTAVLRWPTKFTVLEPATGQRPLGWARDIGKTPKVSESDIIVFSRICPHLGCIYNFVPNYKEVTAGYGGYSPPPPRQHALMAGPCHRSIYDPADPQLPGLVLPGTAPPPPRT